MSLLFFEEIKYVDISKSWLILIAYTTPTLLAHSYQDPAWAKTKFFDDVSWITAKISVSLDFK